MPVKHAFLALLAEHDLTGYEIKVRFERALGEFWQLNSGQVYSTIERMRRAGLVRRRRDVEGARADPPPASGPTRNRYTLTPRGRDALERWLAAPQARLRPVRDPIYVQLVFSGPERMETLLAALTAELKRYGAAVESLQTLVKREPMSHVGRTRWLVAEAVRLHYDAHLRWLATARDVLAPPPAVTRPPRLPPARVAPLRLPTTRVAMDASRR